MQRIHLQPQLGLSILNNGPILCNRSTNQGPTFATDLCCPCGPIWALIFFVENVTFRVQTAPFDKITIDFWRSRRRLYIPDLLKAKNSNVRLSFFTGVVFSSKVLRFGSRRLRLTKWRLISADLGSVYTIQTFPQGQKT